MNGEVLLAELADDMLEQERAVPLMPSNDVLRTVYRAESDAALQLCREAGVETP
jgi:hypothetical protein